MKYYEQINGQRVEITAEQAAGRPHFMENGDFICLTQAQIDAEAAKDASWEAGAAARAAEALRRATDASEQTAVKADSQVMQFLNFTPTQLDNWIANNIEAATTLAQLRTATATALRVLGRIALAAGRGRFLR